MKSVRRIVLAGEILVLAAVLAVAGALWWLLGTEAGLQWTLKEIASASGGRLQFESARGTIAREFAIERVAFASEDLHIDIRGLRAIGNVFGLVAGRLSFSDLHAASIAIETAGEDKPPSAPEHLGLPLGLGLEHAWVDQLVVLNKAQRFEFRNLVLAYDGGPFGQRIRSLTASTPWGEFALNGEIGSTAPFSLSGAAALNWPDASYPAGAGIEFYGNLERMGARLSASVAGVPARGEASIMPFAPGPLRSLEAHLEGLDIERFDPGWPHTAITLVVKARQDPRGLFSGSIAATNARSGPIDRDLLPVASASAQFSGNTIRARLTQIALSLTGGASLAGTGELERGDAKAALSANALDLHALRSDLHSTALNGGLQLHWTERRQTLQASLEQEGMRLVADVMREGNDVLIRSLRGEANGGVASGSGRLNLAGAMRFQARVAFSDLDPSRFGDYPAASLSGTANAEGELREPRRVHAQWSIDRSKFAGLPLASRGSASLQGERLAQVDADVRLGANRGSARGAFGRAGDELQFALDAQRLSELHERLAGSARAEGRLTGGWNNPVVSLNARAAQLQVAPDVSVSVVELKGSFGRFAKAPFDIALSARDASLRGIALQRVNFQSRGNAAAHEARLSASAAALDLDASVRGGWSEQRGWSGQILSLRNRGTYPLVLGAPAPVEVALHLDGAFAVERAKLGRFDASLGDGRLLVREVDWQPGRISSSGEVRGLPAQWLIWAGGFADRLESSLLIDGQWSLNTRERLDGTLELERASGDLRMPGPKPIDFGLQQLAVKTRFDDGRMNTTVDARWRLGTFTAQGQVSPVPDGGALAYGPGSALSLRANFALADVQPIAGLFVTQARIGGRVSAELGAKGTLAAPQLSGSLAGDAISVDMPPYGLYLRGGRLRAQLEGDTLRLSELRLQGGDGQLSASGEMPLHSASDQSGVSLAWEARDFRVLDRPDMRLVVSGDGSVKMGGDKSNARKVALAGKLRANQGRFDLGQTRMPELGDDVVVVGKPRPAQGSMKVPVVLDLDLDLGDDLSLQGRGFDGKIAGQLHVVTNDAGEPLAYGRISAVKATFEAYGQRLQVDPGELVFDGPVRNPSLRVTAWRRNQAVEAGVQLSGTALNPQVQLVSNPNVPEGDRLSWLVLGRAPSEASRGDLGLLQTAAGALLARGNSAPATTRIARAFGFDELALRSGGSDLSTRVVAVGKRLSDRLYITYEQGLGTVVTNLIKLDYSLTQRLSVRAETGTASGLGLFYRFSWD